VPTGYLYFSDDHRHGDLVDRRGGFTDALRSAPKLAVRQVALISLDGDAIDVVGLMTRGNKAASYKWHVRFDEFVAFDPPLQFRELGKSVGARVSTIIATARRTKGVQLAPATWAELKRAITNVRPEVDLDRLERRAAARRPRMFAGDREPIVAYEHDAVGLALSLAGIDRKPVLESWTGSDSAPFLQGVPEFSVIEDRMIDYDATVFGGWQLLRQGAIGIAEFRGLNRRLTVVNVNRAGVEHALGVDLVYYNHDFNAYVLVQYKRMTPRKNGSGYEFRPDRQLQAELERMRRLLSPGEVLPSVRDFRLDDGGAYLKLCPSTFKDAFSHELIRGMYLPLGYWDALVESVGVRGPKGGIRVDFDNVVRHINNTMFIDLVGSGWIGSRGVTSRQITRVVRDSLANRSLLLAEARTEN
jgi:hypothetical protein